MVSAGLLSSPTEFSTNKHIQRMKGLLLSTIDNLHPLLLESFIRDLVKSTDPTSSSTTNKAANCFTLLACFIWLAGRKKIASAGQLQQEELRRAAVVSLRKRILALKAPALAVPLTCASFFALLTVIGSYNSIFILTRFLIEFMNIRSG